MMTTRNPSTRRAGKEHTRQALLRAALKLLSQHSFDSLSLREVTREAGVTPTAFYRHYDDMEQLGLVLVEESFHWWGEMLRAALPVLDPAAIESSLADVVPYVHDHTSDLRFIVRERHGGVRRLRRAITRELQLSADELAVALAARPGVGRWTAQDRRMLAGLITETVIAMVAELLEAGPDGEREIVERTGRRLLLISLGVPSWSSPHGAPRPPAPHSVDGDQPVDGG